jgi:THO complex subunit 1
MDELERRLRQKGSDDEESIQKKLEIAQRELEQAKAGGLHDKFVVNDDLVTAYTQLKNYIFGVEQDSEEPSQQILNDEQTDLADPKNSEVEMVDGEAPAPEESSKSDVFGEGDSETPVDDSAETTIIVEAPAL